MLFAPLFRAGQLPIPLIILELSAVLMLLVALWSPRARSLTRREAAAAVALSLFPLLYLVPLPGLPLDWLPGREPYADAVSLVGNGDLVRPTRLSLYPIETESAWLVLLIPIAVFVCTRMLDSRRLYRLVQLLIAVAGVQAMLGLMQFGGGPQSPLYLGMTHTHVGSAVGTYTNKNHLAGLIEMALPIALALFFYFLGRRENRSAGNGRGRAIFFASLRGHVAFVYGALALLLVVGAMFTRSRAGIALTMLGLVLATFAFARRIGGENVYGPAGTVVAFAVGLGIAIGLAPVLDRFTLLDPMEDGRWSIFASTLDGIGAFFPIGSGPGTYADVFHAFQTPELGRWFVNRAHNDYLEWLFEGGAVAAIVIVFPLGLYLLQWRRVWTREAWSRFRFIQVGAGVGIFLVLLHELVDYNLTIPANMICFAFLAGIFFSDPNQEAVGRSTGRRRRRTAVLAPAAAPATDSSRVKPMASAPDQIRNPFAT